MKGKAGLVLGIGIGYVLGSRAGRERYEQIKRTTTKIWHSDGVQKISHHVTGYVQDQVSCAQDYVLGKTRALLHTATAPQTGAVPEDRATVTTRPRPTAPEADAK